MKVMIWLMFLSFSVLANDRAFSTSSIELKSLLNELEKEIPEKIINDLDSKVKIKFAQLNNKEIKELDKNCQEKMIMARTPRFTNGEPVIYLDNVFLNEIKKGERLLNCRHNSNLNLLKATIAHELLHVYDFKNKLSQKSHFLNIAGFVAKGLVVKKRTNLNTMHERSVDPYEFKNAEESLAVNFEHFLYDSTFKCRKPSMAKFFSEEFELDISQNSTCEINKKIVMTSQNISSSPILVRDLDFSRLYEVHYLFAGKGEEVMSRFGHAMYRLVFCAKGKAKGPSCLNDLSEHVVISFRANITDMTTNYAKGINGEYPSQLFFLTLPEVINEYTKGEFRDVFSLPLKLSEKEKAAFLHRASELYWSYKGKYYFFTNNCATEAMNLLKVAMIDNKEVQGKNVVTPLGLNDFLIKSDIGQADIFNDIKLAERKGYFFPGLTEKLKNSLKILGLNDLSFEEFSKFSAEKRLEFYQKALSVNVDQVAIAANALRIEDVIMRSKEILFAKKLGNELFGSDPNPKLHETDAGQKIKELQELYGKLSPEKFLKPGYGIPLTDEFYEIPSSFVLEINEQIKSYTQDLKLIAQEFFYDEVDELKGTMNNRLEMIKLIGTK